jgi:hypothetical protein
MQHRARGQSAGHRGALLALIAAMVSYLHMHMLVELHGSLAGWRR